MNGYCTIHDTDMRQFEKEGRTWFSHKVGDAWCKGEGLGKAVTNGRAESNGTPIHREPVKDDKPDWDPIAEGKVRHAFALEAYKMGLPIDKGLAKEIDGWVKYVMTGKISDNTEVKNRYEFEIED